MRFEDRRDAGRQLAKALQFLKDRENTVVLGIPRGGVVVAFEVARALGLPLDIYITRKIGAPYNPEFALGAVASDGTQVLDEVVVEQLQVPREYIKEEIAQQQKEIERRFAEYRGNRPPPELDGKTVVLVDDGVATGSTTLAAIRALKKRSLSELILAIPVGPPDTVARLGREVDRVVCLDTPEPFWAVGRFYSVFDQTTDAEVVAILREE